MEKRGNDEKQRHRKIKRRIGGGKEDVGGGKGSDRNIKQEENEGKNKYRMKRTGL